MGFVIPGAPEGSTRRLTFVVVFLEKPGVEPVSDLSTAPRRLLSCQFSAEQLTSSYDMSSLIAKPKSFTLSRYG